MTLSINNDVSVGEEATYKIYIRIFKQICIRINVVFITEKCIKRKFILAIKGTEIKPRKQRYTTCIIQATK